ncbi:MAG: hypothetical protein ABIF04_08205 [Chloroflexota bacterium]
MFRRLFWTLILLAFLAACAPTDGAQAPSQTPIPETATPLVLPLPSLAEYSPTPDTILPAPETFSPTPTETGIPTEAIPTEALTPFPKLDFSPTLAVSDVPQPKVDAGAIQFLGPGPLSKIVSPVALYGYAIPGYGNKGYVELFGEDGRLLSSQLLQLNTAYKWAYFVWNLPFAIETAGELGRLTMSIQDQYGRVTALHSVHLLLLLQGSSLINPSGDLRERCIIEQPVAGKRNSGGVLDVDGKIRPFNHQLLTVELLTRDGSLIGSQMIAVSPTLNDSYVPFRANLPYAISAGTWALLVVRQPDERIPGTVYLYSQEIYLSP